MRSNFSGCMWLNTILSLSLSFSQDEEPKGKARARGPIRVNEKIEKWAVALQPAFNVQVCGTNEEFELIIWSTCVNEVNVTLWYHIRSAISNKTFFKKKEYPAFNRRAFQYDILNQSFLKSQSVEVNTTLSLLMQHERDLIYNLWFILFG